MNQRQIKNRNQKAHDQLNNLLRELDDLKDDQEDTRSELDDVLHERKRLQYIYDERQEKIQDIESAIANLQYQLTGKD